MDMTEVDLKQFLRKLFETRNTTQIGELVGEMAMHEGQHATYFRQTALDRFRQLQSEPAQ